MQKVHESRRYLFQDALVHNPEDLVKQNNLMLRQFLHANSAERHNMNDLLKRSQTMNR